MAPLTTDTDTQFGPWNPGIASQVPERLRPLCTIFRPENALTEYAKVAELRDLTGLDVRSSSPSVRSASRCTSC